MPDKDAKIVKARITEMPKKILDPMPKVMVVVEGSDQEHELFEYYPDEITFTATEFIGKTVAEGHKLKYTKDLAYLRS